MADEPRYVTQTNLLISDCQNCAGLRAACQFFRFFGCARSFSVVRDLSLAVGLRVFLRSARF